MPSTTPLPDAGRQNWVDRYAPAKLKPWLRLGRLDRPIGIWLLFLPGAMGMAFAIAHPFLIQTTPGMGRYVFAPANLAQFPWLKLIFFAIGSVLMRAAGCAFNDFIDRDIDAKVERTRSRPIPAGQISPKQALAFAASCCLISAVILSQLGGLAILLGIGSLGLVAAYPFMKRITWWPQAWLGLTFNWGFVMAVATVTGTLTPAALVFYAGLVFWTIGYDTIYALQDFEDDAMIGVKSSARALGAHAVAGVSIFYGLAVVLTGAAAMMAHLPSPFFGGLFAVMLHLFSQVFRMQIDNGPLALQLFKSNRATGILWVFSLLAVHYSGLISG